MEMEIFNFEKLFLKIDMKKEIESLTMNFNSSYLLFSGRDHKPGDPQKELAILKIKKINLEPKGKNQKVSILKILNVKNFEVFEILKNFEIEAFEHCEVIDNLLKALSDKVLGKMTFKFGLLVLLILINFRDTCLARLNRFNTLLRLFLMLRLGEQILFTKYGEDTFQLMYQDINQPFLDRAYSWRWWHQSVNVLTDVDQVNTVSQQVDNHRAIEVAYHCQEEVLFLSSVHSLRNGNKLRDPEQALTSINSDHVTYPIHDMINCVFKNLKLTFKWIMDIPVNCLSIAVIDKPHNLLFVIDILLP